MNSLRASVTAFLMTALLGILFSCSSGGVARQAGTDAQQGDGLGDGSSRADLGDGFGHQDKWGAETDFRYSDVPQDGPDMYGDLYGPDPCELSPGSFGCPCVSNADCVGGYCIQTGLGGLCTQECLEECPQDWICTGMTGFGSDLVFLCVPPHKSLCVSCTQDGDCTGNKCIVLDGEKQCVYKCEGDSDCPQGFLCLPLDTGGAATTYCMPESGSCSCLLEDNQTMRPCIRENDFGVCTGFQSCDSKLGWGACSASLAANETCDGTDNDCDGKYDEGLPEYQPCEISVEGIGVCKANATCAGISGWVCPAQTPAAELCDYVDNDCDGSIDDGFQVGGKYVHAEHCGSCGSSCANAVPNGTALCNTALAVPQCHVKTCNPGYYQANMFQCQLIGDTQCKPCFNELQCEGGACASLAGANVCLKPCTADAECPEFAGCQEVEGKVGSYCVPQSGDCLCTAESTGLEKQCAVTTANGVCYGKQICDPSEGWSSCSASLPSPEVCDGLDNDCNGLPDDALPEAEACETTVEGVGTCTGIRQCFGHQGWVCSAAVPTTEVCDNQDNNCNGEVDEEFKVGTEYVTLQHCGGCGKTCEGTLPNAVAVCDASDGTPVCRVQECLPGFYHLNDFQCIAPPEVQCSECTDDSQCYLYTCALVEDSKHCLKPCAEQADCDQTYECLESPAGGRLCYPLTGSCRCTEENVGLQWACTNENEWGTCFGVQVCEAIVGWSLCSAKVPAHEICNGLNDDCDGLVDEGLPESLPCANESEWGSCPGQAICMGTPGWVCMAATPTEEVCDYLDNDCDGLVDELFVVGGKYTGNDHCGTCNNACVDSIVDATGVCDGSYSVPKCVVESCDEGFIQISPFQCVAPPDTTCQVCNVDADCLGSLCVVVDGEKRCAAPCSDVEFGVCEGAYVCQMLPGFETVCLPVTGSCACSAENEGIKRSCSVENALGTCYGVETCASEGWSGCTAPIPSVEECNGKDDDCNGIADEGLPDFQACEKSNLYGTCSGQAVCAGALGWICQASVPAMEACDYLDNDCDGQVDELFKEGGKYVLDQHCGACNSSCLGAIPNATSVCDGSYPTPKCVVDQCDEGYFQLSPFQCIVPPDSTCYDCALDSDCQGGHCMTIDGEDRCVVHCPEGTECSGETTCQELPDVGSVCYPTTGSCTCNSYTAGSKRTCMHSSPLGTCYGYETCDSTAGWSVCDAPQAGLEVCNGVDDDCNALVDDGLPASMECAKENAWGTCVGQAVCLGPLGWVCQAKVPAPEECDYMDNDCDGSVDEEFKQGGSYVLDEHCGACNASCANAIPNASAVCDASYATPRCVVEQCNSGYFQVSPFQCILPPDSTCFPCQVDADCMGGRCVTLDGETRCVIACEEQSDCAGETTCKSLGTAPLACIPDTGSCTCNSYRYGSKRSCMNESSIGTCYGYETCGPTSGWSLCDASVAIPEICNGVDDDCDGQPDDGMPSTTACEESNAWGTCEGVALCLGPLGWVCQAPVPAEEVCDYLDNDCDGAVDEEFKAGDKYVVSEHCGACNNSCEGAIPNSTTRCDATYPTPKCVVDQCAPGYFQVSPFQCIVPPDSTCFFCQADADCLGGKCVLLDGEMRCVVTCQDQTDCLGETSCQSIGGGSLGCKPITGSCTCNSYTPGVKRSCLNVSSVGTCYGYETCNPTSGWSPCDAPTATLEVCNGTDDDCNGQVDDGLPPTTPCSRESEWGLCTGLATCLGTLGWVCPAEVPGEDICDYLDNDCDGTVDEDFKQGPKYVTYEHCGACNTGCMGAIPNATARCDATYATPRCVVDQCDPGYFQVSPIQCIVPPDSTCFFCQEDEDCLGGKCVTLDGELRCVVTCEEQADCLGETTCESLGTGSSACVPITGSCTCNSYADGSKRSCLNTSVHGTCYGYETCEATTGWGACDAPVAAVEVCNGTDDDCDGQPDDGLPATLDCQESNSWGTCTGLATCLGPLGWVCQASIPAEDVCDYQDNNCNGTVDEAFQVSGRYIYDDNCGTCLNSCIHAIPHATGTCDAATPQPRCIVSSCDPGYVKVSDFQCVTPPNTTCQACATDTDCLGSLCLTIDGKKRCAKACASEPDCAEGTSCVEYATGSTACLPDSGSCECSTASSGTKRTCSVSNGFGVCFGFETCMGDAGWSSCSAAIPASESCNGVDDDCDGAIDDSLPATQPCSHTNAYGTCTGIETCGGTLGWLCQAATPAAETCDYADNDCDGTVDEEFKVGSKYVSLQHCGSCNNNCYAQIPNATGKCDGESTPPRCVVDQCSEGYVQTSPFECIPEPDTTCQACTGDPDCLGGRCIVVDGKSRCAIACTGDGDCSAEHECALYTDGSLLCQPQTGSCECSGLTDGNKRACSNSNGVGTCYGFETCDSDTGWSICTASIPTLELCDGMDNDCDSAIDNNLPSSMPCESTNAFGTCAGSATCYGAAGWICQAPTATAEVCDYLDNNCNGLVDEVFRNGSGDYYLFDTCGTCTVSCAVGFPNATARCDATRDPPRCVVDTCNPGYMLLNEFQCIPTLSTLCETCFTDDNCVFSGSKCVVMTDGSYCGKACGSDADCPSGYSCDPWDGTLQCIPVSNTCSCSPTNVGMGRDCSATWPPAPAPGDPFTTCYGMQTCEAAGWGSCVLPAESCDTTDNDCDGVVDDGFLVGGKYIQDTNCGQCGNNCTFLYYPNALAHCDSSLAVPSCEMECIAAYFDVNMNPADGCECLYQGPTDVPDALGVDSNCDGVDGELGNAIFVAKNGSDTNSGADPEHPMLTIQAAMEKALTAAKRDVYVATGVYSQSLDLKAAVKTYGGYSSDFKQRHTLLYETVVMGQAFTTTKPGAVNAVGIVGAASTTVFDGFTIFGRNNNTLGGSSYAIYIQNCDDALLLSNNVIEAGSGGNGAKGLDGTSGDGGTPGNPGAAAYGVSTKTCSSVVPALPRAGAVGGVRTCGGTNVSGGSGGGNTCPTTYNAAPVAYENGTAGLGGSGGAGGSGGYDREVWYCNTFPSGECHQPTSGPEAPDGGNSGSAGGNGNSPAGNGCSGAVGGQVSSGLWVPATGLVGAAGSHGSGGGGGGAGGGAQNNSSCSARTHVGGTGGGGGSGGCAGTGGYGGSGGGGSFGIFMVWVAMTPTQAPFVTGNTVYGGFGGAGGNGGNGGSGGPGGSGGSGGADNYSAAKCAAPGGYGGSGGNGGHGEGGGGGCGGASFSLFVYGAGTMDLSSYAPANSLIAGTPGSGGSGGPSIGNTGDTGATGPSGATNF